MKITKKYLQKIISEETKQLLEGESLADVAENLLNTVVELRKRGQALAIKGDKNYIAIKASADESFKLITALMDIHESAILAIVNKKKKARPRKMPYHQEKTPATGQAVTAETMVRKEVNFALKERKVQKQKSGLDRIEAADRMLQEYIAAHDNQALSELDLPGGREVSKQTKKKTKELERKPCGPGVYDRRGVRVPCCDYKRDDDSETIKVPCCKKKDGSYSDKPCPRPTGTPK